MSDPTTPREPAPREERDVTVWIIPLAVVLTLVMVGVVLLGSGLLIAVLSGPEPVLTPTLVEPPEPRLQVAPAGDWDALKATQEAGLNRYGWIDREAGIAQIPIDRAMALLAATYTVTPVGTPTPAATGMGTPAETAAGTPTQRGGGA